MTTTAPLPSVLLVEDNPGDVRLAKEALAELEVSVSLTVASNGVEALELLRAENGDTQPQLVLLDINLPDTDGGSILAEIKSDERLRRIPVVVLTTSDQARDVQRMYDNHANAYVTKPETVSEFITTIDHLVSFWLSTATLPTQER